MMSDGRLLWKLVKWRSPARPRTRGAAATVRRPGDKEGPPDEPLDVGNGGPDYAGRKRRQSG